MRRPHLLLAIILFFVCARVFAQAPAASGSFRIAGRLVNATTGAPVPKAAVSILTEDSSGIVSATLSDADGRFMFDHLPAGKFPLTASKRGFRTSFYDEHDEFSSAIVTGEGQDTERLVFQIAPNAVLSGVVTADGGDPVEGASVMLFRNPLIPGQQILHLESTSTDDTGAYEFNNLGPGEYFVAVQAEPWYALHTAASQAANGERSPLDVAYPITFYDSTTEDTAAAPIALGPGDRQQADITLHAVPAVHLKVLGTIGERGVPTVDVKRIVFGIPLESGDADTAGMSRGSVQVAGLAPGHYQVTQGVPPRTLDLNASSDTEVDPSSGISTVVVTGSIRDSNGSPVQELTLALTPADDPQGRTPLQATVQNGQFRFEGVTPGPWSLEPFPFGNGSAAPAIVAIAQGGVSSAGNLICVGDRPIRVVATISQSQTTIKGFARKGDRPAPGVMVVLVAKDPGAYTALVRRDQSDSDGSFTLHDVAAGQYTVIAIEDGWKLNWRDYKEIARFLPGGVNVNLTEHSGATLNLPRPVQAAQR